MYLPHIAHTRVIKLILLVETWVRYMMCFDRLLSTFSKVFRNWLVWASSCLLAGLSRANSERACPV